MKAPPDKNWDKLPLARFKKHNKIKFREFINCTNSLNYDYTK